MSAESDPREVALSRIDALHGRIAAHAEEAAALHDALDALRADVAAIPVTAAAGEQRPEPAAEDPADAGARLIALDLVTSGVPRDEAVLRMAADFPGVDVATLVDEAATSRG